MDELKFAIMDKRQAAIPMLFKSVKKGVVAQNVLLTYKYGDVDITVKGYEPLRPFDLRLLCVLLALGNIQKMRLSSCPKTEFGKALRENLGLMYDALKMDAIAVNLENISLRKLAEYMGLSSKTNMHIAVKESLERFMTTTFIVESPEYYAGFNMLSSFSISKGRGRKITHVALNPFLVESVMGNGGKGYSYLNLIEMNKIQEDYILMLHYRLCTILSEGESGIFNDDTLIKYWIDVNTKIDRKHKQRLKKALDFLSATLNWKIDIEGKKVNIRRLKQ